MAKDATPGEVRRAYRRRARETHPDQGGTAHAFRAVQHAWEQIGAAGAGADRAGDVEDVVWSPTVPAAGWGRVQVRPGRRVWAGRAGLIVATLLWAACGIALVVPSPDPDGLLGFSWAGPGMWWSLIWLAGVLVSSIRAIGSDYSAGLVVCAVLLVVAAFSHIGTVWWWAGFAWAAVGFFVPLVRTLLDRPMWTITESLADGPVFGTVPVGREESANLVELLCEIPAVRIFHGTPGAAHVVVCGAQVVAFDVEEGWEFPGVSVARTWSLEQLLDDRTCVLDQAAKWLTAGGGGVVVDRRVLADV